MVIDVRTDQEFITGNVPGSLNIPLHQILERIEEIKKIEEPIVLCCASGIRSAQALEILKSNGITCENAGSWLNLI